MKKLLQKANCPSCDKSYGYFLSFKMHAAPESFIRCPYCEHRYYLSGAIYWGSILIGLMGCLLIWSVLLILFSPIFESENTLVKTTVGFIIMGVGLAGSDFWGSQVLLSWLSKQPK